MRFQSILYFKQWSFNTETPYSTGGMAQQTSTNNALGTLIGYVGAEAATHETFERLLWPQRFYNGFSWHNSIKMALFLPMGAPLHKAALATLDQIRKNGLFKGHEQGHMLGSPFYQDTHLGYSAHNCFNTGPPENEWVRNCLWVRAIANIPPPSRARLTGSRSVESGLRETGMQGQQKIRAINRVSYLRLSVPSQKRHLSEAIGYETGPASIRTYLALITTELTAIITGTMVVILWRSWFMLLWFAPLLLKLVSAYLAVSRGSLEIPSQPSQSSTNSFSHLSEKLAGTSLNTKKYEIYDPLNGFLIVEGEENVVLQFFRHYGHPIRNRFREVSQILIIIAFGALFPIGLICSILWMPLSVQYMWLAYQLYTTLAMYVYHFSEGHSLGTTEQTISQYWENNLRKGQKQKVYFGGKNCVLMAELEVTYHSRVREGKAHMELLLSSEVPSLHERSNQSESDTTVSSSPDHPTGSTSPAGNSVPTLKV